MTTENSNSQLEENEMLGSGGCVLNGEITTITNMTAPPRIETPEGMDMFGDEREFLRDFEKFFNNAYLSDVTLIVGDEVFNAHRLMLVKSSEVFERMLSDQWNGNRKEIELVEEPNCVKVFPAFLRFMYVNHVLLHCDNTLPLLMLADKYNVGSLRKVCLYYAVNDILPNVSLKELFHVWFQYATKCSHSALVRVCIQELAANFSEISDNTEEWGPDWCQLDRDQLMEFLKCNELNVENEFKLWKSVEAWLMASGHPERRGNTAAPLLASILPLIRFPFMTPDELTLLERSPVVDQHYKLFMPHIMNAYKWQALPLSSRVGPKEFLGTQFLLRTYSELRWDKRLCVEHIDSILRYQEMSLKFSTRASAVQPQEWDWELKVHPKGYTSSTDEFRVFLSSNVILDQTRPVEYLLQMVDDKKVVRSVSGKKTFTKTRYCLDLEVEKKVGLEELLAENSPLLVGDNLYIQIFLKPID